MAAAAIVLAPERRQSLGATELAQPSLAAAHCTPPCSPDDSESLYSYQSVEDSIEQQQESVAHEAPAGPRAAAEPVPSKQAMAASPHYPVLVTAEELPGVSVRCAASDGGLPINNGRPIPFESELFEGQACVFIRGLPTTPAVLFKGQKRRTLLVVQGQFRLPVGYDDLVTGQEFERAKNLPPAWLLDNVLLKVARTISPSMEVGPARAPFMLMPVVAGCNEIHVAAPGQQPPLGAAPREDMRLVEPKLAGWDGAALPFGARRAFFTDPANRVGRAFGPGLVWTFYFYQHLVDVSDYSLNVVYRFKLPHYLDGQPLQLMMKDRQRGRYLFKFQMWHEALLHDAERQAQHAER